MEKTLIGNNGYLFLKNDDSRELEVHCNNLCLVINDLSRFQKYIDKYYITIFPDKSYIYKQFLPSNYQAQYRPGLLKYKSLLNDKLFDAYDILKNIDNPYYKTDTHINLNGAYSVYINFIEKINLHYSFDIPVKDIKIKNKNVILSELNIGLGDLTWESNKGNQELDNILDTYYYSDELIQIYCQNNNQDIVFYDKNLINKSDKIIDKIIDWYIISDHILYKKNNNTINKKVIIFYDSFLLSTLSLYLTMFYEVYMIKDVYNTNIIDKINPDLIFEFRVERFLF
jgi:hypothetical protein